MQLNDKVRALPKKTGRAVTMTNRRIWTVAVSLATPVTIESAHGQQMKGGNYV